MSRRLATASAALDIQTGGGELLAEAAVFPPTIAATEAWPPNVATATNLLHPRGVVVVATPDEPPLPFADTAFDLATSRHPATVWWSEIARVLVPGGAYFAQHVGPASTSCGRSSGWCPTYRDRLRELHDQIEGDGVFVAYSSRTLIEARRQS